MALCVEYADPRVSSREVIADDAPDKVYVPSFHWLEFAYKVKKPTCPDGSAPVMGKKDLVKFPGHETTYFVLCLAKSRVSVDGGTRISDAKFLKQISVDMTKDRPSRTGIEQHAPIDWLAHKRNDNMVNFIFD